MIKDAEADSGWPGSFSSMLDLQPAGNLMSVLFIQVREASDGEKLVYAMIKIYDQVLKHKPQMTKF